MSALMLGLSIGMPADLSAQNNTGPQSNPFGTRLNQNFFGPQFPGAAFNSAGMVNPPVPYQCLAGYMTMLAPTPEEFESKSQADDDEDDDDLGLDDKKPKKTLSEVFEEAQSGSALRYSCPKPDPFTRTLSCDSTDLMDKSGNFSLENLNGLIRRNEQAVASHVCQQKKIDLLYKDISCLQAKGQQLQQFIGSLGNVFFRETQKFSQAMRDFNLTLSGLSQQQQEIALRLNGNEATGEPGIAQLEQLLTRGQGTVAARISGDLNRMRKTWDVIQETVQQVDQTFSSEIIQETQQCFRERKSPRLKCLGQGSQKGQVVACSREDYLLQQIESRAMVDENGNIKQRAKNRNEARSKVNLVKSVLDRFYGETAKLQPQSNDSNQINNFINGKFNVTSLKEIYAYFNKALAGISVPGVNLSSYISAAMGGCYNFAFKTVQRRSTRSGSRINILRQRLRNLKFDADQQTDTILGNYEEDIQKVFRILAKDTQQGGHFVPPSRDVCKSSTGKAQVSCVQQYGRYLDKLVRGDHPDANTVMQFVGNRYVPAKNIVCAGLAQCKTKLQNEARTFVRNVNSVREAQSDFAEAARNNYQNFVQNLATQLGGQNGQNALVNQHLKELQQVIGKMGISPGLDFKSVKPEAMKFVTAGKGPNGEDIKVPGAPNNPSALIAGMMGAPLVDFAGSNFSDAIRGITKKQEKIKEEKEEISEKTDEMAALKSECTTDILADKADELKDFAEDYRKACGWLENYFGGKDKLDQFSDNLKNVASIWGGDIGRILRSGVREVQDGMPSQEKLTRADRILKEKRELEIKVADLRRRQSEIGGERQGRSLASIDNNVRRYEDQLLSIESTINQRQEELNGLTGENGQLSEARSSLNTARTNLSNWLDRNPPDNRDPVRLQLLQEALAVSRSQLQQLQQKESSLRSELRARKSEKAQAERQLSRAKSDRDELQSKNLNSEEADITRELSLLQSKLLELNDDYEDEKSKRRTGQQNEADCDSIASDLFAKEQEILDATKKYRKLSSGDKAK